jgi:hypothetical protein
MAQKKLAPELAPAIRRLNNSGSLGDVGRDPSRLVLAEQLPDHSLL